MSIGVSGLCLYNCSNCVNKDPLANPSPSNNIDWINGSEDITFGGDSGMYWNKGSSSFSFKQSSSLPVS